MLTVLYVLFKPCRFTEPAFPTTPKHETDLKNRPGIKTLPDIKKKQEQNTNNHHMRFDI